MGWDAFGLPAEHYAVKTGTHPRLTTEKNIATFRRQLQRLGFSYDWSREVDTTDPDYVRWTQWIFLKLYERGLAYEAFAPVNWCPALGAVLSNEEVVNGRYARSAAPGRAASRCGSGCSASPSTPTACSTGSTTSTGPSPSRRCSATGSDGARARRSTSASSVTPSRPCCASTRRARTRSSAPRSWSSHRSIPSSSSVTTPEQSAAVEDYVEAAARKTDRDRAGAMHQDGRVHGRERHQPGQRPQSPDLDRGLRARDLRHRRDHGLSRRTTSATGTSPPSTACRSRAPSSRPGLGAARHTPATAQPSTRTPAAVPSPTSPSTA